MTGLIRPMTAGLVECVVVPGFAVPFWSSELSVPGTPGIYREV